MSWRIVSVSSKAKLDFMSNYLVVRTAEKTVRIHLSEIALLLIESTAVSLTAYLLCELNRQKIRVLFCDEKRSPYGELYPLHGSYDTSRKIREQLQWSDESKKFIWGEIVRAKICRQRDLLPAEELRGRALLQSYAEQVEPGDATNREGHAAKVYFNCLFGMDFSRSSEHPVNHALNYGYTVLLSAFSRVIASCGYLTQVGICHDNVLNPYNLSCDLMEPFRPFADRAVCTLTHHESDREVHRCMINVLNQEVRLDGKKQILLNAIRLYSQSVFEALEQEDIAPLCFPEFCDE